MPSLSELQTTFSAHLLAGDPAADASLSSLLAPGIPADAALAIYRNNVHSRFNDALADIFPAVRRIVGDEFFRATARCYMAAHPCRAGTLIGIGQQFAAFLAVFEPAGKLPYLADVAMLEWLHRDAYHAADAVPVTPADFHAMASAQGDLPALCLHPSVRLMSTQYPVIDVWDANRREGEVPPMTLSRRGECLLIARPHTDVAVRKVTCRAFALLRALESGASFEVAVSAAGDADVAFQHELASLFMASAFTLSGQEPKP